MSPCIVIADINTVTLSTMCSTKSASTNQSKSELVFKKKLKIDSRVTRGFLKLPSI